MCCLPEVLFQAQEMYAKKLHLPLAEQLEPECLNPQMVCPSLLPARNYDPMIPYMAQRSGFGLAQGRFVSCFRKLQQRSRGAIHRGSQVPVAGGVSFQNFG